LNTKLPTQSKISAKKSQKTLDRICQGDIFSGIEIIENVTVSGSKLSIDKLYFPYVICLNQECDLESDYKIEGDPCKNARLLHIAIAPAFNFEEFLIGTHWDSIFIHSQPVKRKDTKIDLITDNEIPRYHYLNFPDTDMPELIVDFKHFFTISRNQLYLNIERRLCSLEDLFKEKLSQRFSNFISRIGLPEHNSLEI
jgi:hypothetical protein